MKLWGCSRSYGSFRFSFLFFVLFCPRWVTARGKRKSQSRDKASFAWLPWSCLRIILCHWSGHKGASWLVLDASNRKARFLQTDASPGSVLAPLASEHSEGSLNAHQTPAEFKFKGFITRTRYSDTRATFIWLIQLNVCSRNIFFKKKKITYCACIAAVANEIKTVWFGMTGFALP